MGVAAGQPAAPGPPAVHAGPVPWRRGPQAHAQRPVAAVTPGPALASLRAALAAYGITTTGMALARLSGTLYPGHGPAIGYHHGLYWWPARRPHRARPLYAIHDASDPPGAARRIAASHQPATAAEQ